MKLQGLLALFAVATISAAAGCAGQPDAGAPAAAESSTAMPAAASHGAATGASQLVSGTVLETMDAAGYTYVRVDTGDAEIWAASNRFEVAAGDRVTLPLETPMEGFHSASLDRDFDRIYFASFIVQEGEVPAAPPQGGAGELPPGHPSLDAFKVEPGAAAAAINAPSGGVTIADVWRDKADLSGTTVTVRGRVVKYNAGILGRNWLHLQDGSGELAAGTNDLTVTTTGTVAVGDVVTATGTVATDRDFGAGYTYTVMIEDAAVTAQ
jgi:hypothetical protein